MVTSPSDEAPPEPDPPPHAARDSAVAPASTAAVTVVKDFLIRGCFIVLSLHAVYGGVHATYHH